METKQSLVHEERIINAKNGFLMLFVSTLLLAASIAMCILGPVLSGMDRISGGLCGFLIALGLVLFIVSIILYCGLKILNPNEALVFALFGKYYGTLKKPGYFWINPFCSPINPIGSKNSFTMGANGHTSVTTGTKKISLKTMTLDNGKQKVNDELGNPVEIGAIVIWKVVNPTQAVINVENYKIISPFNATLSSETQPASTRMIQASRETKSHFVAVARKSRILCSWNFRRKLLTPVSRLLTSVSRIWHMHRRSHPPCCRDSKRQLSSMHVRRSWKALSAWCRWRWIN